MATFNGTTVSSSVHGGWRAVVEYTTSETATDYTVTVGVVRACPVDATGKTSLQDASTQGAAMTQNVSVSATGKSATTKTTAPTRSQYPYPPIEWYTHISLYWTFNKTMTWAKGHADAAKTITVKEVLGNISLWYSTSSSVVSDERNVPGTSTATFNVTIPALASYTVSLDAQGGTVAPATLTKWHGEALALPQPAKDCYAFAGWALASAPTTVVYQPGDSYTANSDASLVAVYSPIITSATITQIYAARDDGSFTWDSQTGTHTSASDDGEYVYIRAWWRVDGADAATISLGASMADTSTVWTGATRQVSKPGTGELYVEGVAEWGTTQTALVTGQYDVTVTLSPGSGNPSDTRGVTVSTAFFTIDVLAGGHGIAFGKPATRQIFDVGMDANFDQDVTIGGNVTATGDVAGADVLASSGLSGATLSTTGNATVGGNLIIGDPAAGHSEDSVVSSGTRYFDIYDSSGNPVWRWYMSYAGNIARQEYKNGAWQTARYYRSDIMPGESLGLSGFIATGHLTNSKKSADVTVPFPRTLSSAVSSASVTGTITVRQNNLYLFGSTSSTPRNLSALTVSVLTAGSNGFITLRITGTEQTNAINNNPVTVHFNTLTVTFS